MGNNKKEFSGWIHPADIETVRTSDYKLMVGKYLASNALKEWDEEFTDVTTGEVVAIHRCEVLLTRGTYITKDVVQKIQFYIESGEFSDVEVTDNTNYVELLIPCGFTPFEVVVRIGLEKYKYLVCAQTADMACRIAPEYAAMHCGHSGMYDIFSVSKKSMFIKDEALTPSEAISDHFICTSRLEYYDMFEDKMKVQKDTVVLLASEVGEAKESAYAYFSMMYAERLKDPDSTLRIIKAQPYEVDAVIPLEYSKYYKEKSNL